MIFLDTNVLSLIFRRNQMSEQARMLRYRLLWLASQGNIAIPCIVVQELLSGIRHSVQFERIRESLLSLPVIQTTIEQHIVAAQITNQCMTSGIATHVTDALLAALALEVNGKVLTEDPDFKHMANHCHVQVLSVEEAIRP